ncbi:cytochrome c3 family protein [Roseiconus lacunae]|uniref:cytochrome c3 family protein n=1 Tax=Roseiconus lacunae TaxID=2605694 RepID=UPI001F1E8676|nr:cytochrome c3 family protein [Roseiconus lacunae]
MATWFIAIAILAVAVCVFLGIRFRSGVMFLSASVLCLAALAVLMPREVNPIAEQSLSDPPESAPSKVGELRSSETIRQGERSNSSPDQTVSPRPNAARTTVPPASAGEQPSDDTPDVTLAKLEVFRPIEVPTDGFVGSDACVDCHPNNHATWAASYHSTMTQVADPEIVLGDFDDVSITNLGHQYKMQMKDGVCSVVTTDPEDPSKLIDAPVVMTTGSHHMQVYWFATGEQRLVGMFPLIHLNETGEWIPRQSAFLVPPGIDSSFEMGRWNDVCSGCHSTQRKGRRLASGQWDTHVGEFGISCEACHGPGADHLAFHAQPSRSLEDEGSANRLAKDPIVNPANLSKVRSGQVCGQCHSVIDPKRMDLQFQEHGHQYRPGKDLTETHSVWHRDSPEFERTRKTLNYPDLDTLLNETYYPDGMIRVSGREYNGLIDSPCYLNGEMTCLSCHDLHQDASDTRPIKEWANDQLSEKALANDACTQCHDSQQYGTTHTHHAPESVGSNCYNCHMPHTTYGLLKAIRSHQISSPDVGKDHAAKRPNACNLCHLDQTLAWSADHLDQWYDIEPPTLDPVESSIAASIIWLTRSDAGQRAIAAWHMGWEHAQIASGNEWQLPFLTALVDDDYEAIRLIARRSIQSLPGGADFTFDVVTSSTSDERQLKALQLLQSWLQRKRSKEIQRPELLILGEEGIAVDQLRALIDQRDHTPVSLSE